MTCERENVDGYFREAENRMKEMRDTGVLVFLFLFFFSISPPIDTSPLTF